MKHSKHQSLQKISILLLTWTVISSACFITDCPRRRGKKNSFSENVLTSHGSELRQVQIINSSFHFLTNIIFSIIPIASFYQKCQFNSVHYVDRHLDREIRSPILHQPRFVALEKICVALQTLDASHQTRLQIPYVH